MLKHTFFFRIHIQIQVHIFFIRTNNFQPQPLLSFFVDFSIKMFLNFWK